jgi:hypothetical protein
MAVRLVEEATDTLRPLDEHSHYLSVCRSKFIAAKATFKADLPSHLPAFSYRNKVFK